MYTIYINGEVIHNYHFKEQGFVVSAPILNEELGKTDSLTFTIPPTNPGYHLVDKLKSIVTVYENNEEIFRGRVLDSEKDAFNNRTVFCEGELAFLLDTIQSPFQYTGDLSGLFEMFVKNHNSQVEADKQFNVGKVIITDSDSLVSCSNEAYLNTWESMKKSLTDTYGGYLLTRYENGQNYIDYLEDTEHVSRQTIEFKKNLVDITECIDASDVFSILIPLGGVTDQETHERLTIKSVNDNKDYIEKQDAIKLFGRITKVQQWDEIDAPGDLLSKAKDFLDNSIGMAVSLTLKAIDMNLLDVNIEKIRRGDWVRVKSPPHDVDKYFLVSKIKKDLEDPGKNEMILGVNFTSLTEKQVQQQKKIDSNVEEVKTAASSVTKTVTEVRALAERAEDTIGSVEQVKQEVKQEVADIREGYVPNTAFAEFQEEIYRRFEELEREENQNG